MDHEESTRLYGPWTPRTPADVAALLSGYPGSWWIAGGWAIEEFTGVPRPHGDIDPSIPRSETPLLRDHVRGRFDVWAADSGTLRPLVGDDDTIPEMCGNLWLRPGGADPWEYDVILMGTVSGRWEYKRHHQIALPLTDILRRRGGIDYLRPEIQLLYKAPGLRPQDQQDFDACLPLLDSDARTWLCSALETAHPGHPWAKQLC